MIFPKFIKIQESSLRFFRILAEHLFLTSLIFMLISILFGLLVFYRYAILSQRVEPEPGEVIKFQENTYKKIINEWQGREDELEAVKTKEYHDPFK